MDNKKTKLTISGNPKKSFKNLSSSKTQGKKTVIIDKQTSRSTGKGSFAKSFVIGGDFGAKDGLIPAPLLKEEDGFSLPRLGLKDPPLFGNFPVCFSITTAFLL